MQNNNIFRDLPQKTGLFDYLWQALIRPPHKMKYSTQDLGPNNFIVQSTIGIREDFTVINSRDQTLQCSYFCSKNSEKTPHPCVIYLHGNSSSRIEGVNLVEYLLPYDISVVLMDFAGCGLSEGEYISLGYFEKYDASLVIDYVIKNKPITNFGIWGRSMGASTAIQLGTLRSDITTIVSDSSFLNLKQVCTEVAKKQYKLPQFILSMLFYFVRKKIMQKANFDINDCDTEIYAEKPKNQPNILFIAAKNDQLIHNSHTIQLHDKYPGQKDLLLFDGNHNTKRSNHTLTQISKYFRKTLYDSQPFLPKMNTYQQKEILDTEIPVPQLNGGNIFMSNEIVSKEKDQEDMPNSDESDSDEVPDDHFLQLKSLKQLTKKQVDKIGKKVH